MQGTIEVIKFDVGQKVLPFINKTEFLRSGEGHQGVVLAQTIEFNGLPGEVALCVVSPSDNLDNFETPLGDIRKSEDPPLKPRVSFVIHTSASLKELLAYKPSLDLGNKQYDVSYDQKQIKDFKDFIVELLYGRIAFGGGVRIDGSLLSPKGSSRVVPVLLPHDLSTLSRGIALSMKE